MTEYRQEIFLGFGGNDEHEEINTKFEIRNLVAAKLKLYGGQDP